MKNIGILAVQGAIAEYINLLSQLKKKIEVGLPVFWTCAKMIILAKTLSHDPTTHLTVMDIKVVRNTYGR